MRIRSVPKGNPLDWCGKSVHRELSGCVLLSEVPTDSRVICGGHLKRFQRQLASQILTDITLAIRERVKEGGVIGRIGKDGNTLVVLRGRP